MIQIKIKIKIILILIIDGNKQLDEVKKEKRL